MQNRSFLVVFIAPAALLAMPAAKGEVRNVGPETVNAQIGPNPTLAEIGKANDAAWAAIRSIDLEYETTEEYVINGKSLKVRSPGQRWCKDGDRERLCGQQVNLCAHNAETMN